MPRRTLWWLLVLLLLVPLAAQDSKTDRRFMTRGKPLAEQLQPGDRHVAITINADEPLWLKPPAGVTWERFWADVSGIVIVARVERVSANLVYRDDVDPTNKNPKKRSATAEEERANWIVSSVLIHVEQVLKGAPALSAGDRLQIEDDGGTATVKGVSVDAIIPWERPLKNGKRYLMFGSIFEGGRFSKLVAYEEPSPGAPLLSTTNLGKDHRLEDLSMVQAVDYIESELRK